MIMTNKSTLLAGAILLTGLLLVSACSSFLDETSPNDIDAATAITDAASAEAALIGTYSSLQNGSYYGGQLPLVTEPLCNNASTGGYQFLSLDQLGSNSVTPANLLVEGLWAAIYRSIANCNYLLEALPKVGDLDPARKSEIEAQARAIRALAHFDLLRHFGEHWDQNSTYGIPVITTVQKITDIPTRASVRASYDAILADLDFAVANLNADDTNVQYINHTAAAALLARVHLFRGTLTDANFYATLALENQSLALLPTANYSDLFNTRRSSESIFELSFDVQNRSDYNGLTYGRDDAVRSEIFYLASEGLSTFFSQRPGDVRAALLDFDPTNNNVTITPDGRTQKYRGESTKDNPAYVLRLAEMYLVRAAAKGYPAGLDDLNTLRTARGAEAFVQVMPAPDWDGLILDEVRAEFNFEGQYYCHLSRTGRYSDISGVEAFRGILPIPTREVAASGGKIVQNQGY
jgi:starch-binding outer membrane protein, SusD/RagB family